MGRVNALYREAFWIATGCGGIRRCTRCLLSMPRACLRIARKPALVLRRASAPFTAWVLRRMWSRLCSMVLANALGRVGGSLAWVGCVESAVQPRCGLLRARWRRPKVSLQRRYAGGEADQGDNAWLLARQFLTGDGMTSRVCGGWWCERNSSVRASSKGSRDTRPAVSNVCFTWSVPASSLSRWSCSRERALAWITTLSPSALMNFKPLRSTMIVRASLRSMRLISPSNAGALWMSSSPTSSRTCTS